MKATSKKFSSLERKFRGWIEQVNAHLLECLPPKGAVPNRIHEAMHYSVFSGGKRLRPILAIASCEACGGALEQVIKPACAIEIFHTFSLVHDDLPALDNDDLRRGKPTCHRQFDEATALLAGDALLNFGFEILAGVPDKRVAVRLVREFAQALGTHGMIGGQLVDKESESRDIDFAQLESIHTRKTAKLMQVSCLTGAIVSSAGPVKERAVSRFGEDLGLAFQLIDDIMDGNGYASLTSKQEARRRAEELTERAQSNLAVFEKRAARLKELADFLLTRDH